MSAPLRVLVVDDERISRRTTCLQLREAGYDAEDAENAFAALQRVEAEAWDVVLTDLRMPGMDGLELLQEIEKRRPELDVVVMTAYGSVESAVAAMKHGAADYLTKPFRFQELDLRLQRIGQLRESRSELGRLRALLDESGSARGIFGRSAGIRAVCERIPLMADSQSPLLIHGETGTGKELVARAVHDLGPRRRRPFVALACGAIPRELAESQLFGHEKGAFTGAVSRRTGYFEQAHSGTILLDDVDDLPADIQVKLLRVLQEGTLRRVGGNDDIEIDVRVIGTTKVELGAAVEEGRFRSDLYYRLHGLEIRLPPLRDRGDDVLLLAQHFLRVIASKEGTPAKALAPDAAVLVRRHPWPGNVRELRRAIESAITLCTGDEIGPQHLPEAIRAERDAGRAFTLHLGDKEQIQLPDVLRQFEEEILKWAMQRAQGQQNRAAELLGLPRTTLQSKLRVPRPQGEGDDEE